ncbi:MAG: hypothetical protein RDV48_23100 [Candidatus Eremiobacteraeota bacterium]|nr:hypothetical protein [Candidatus Eremiobacteraeota bacterium]
MRIAIVEDDSLQNGNLRLLLQGEQGITLQRDMLNKDRWRHRRRGGILLLTGPDCLLPE